MIRAFIQKYLLNYFGEFIILLFVFIIAKNFLGNRLNSIEGDGRGYYEFLPAIFIYNDLSFSYLDTLKCDNYDNKIMAENFYPRLENDTRFDKYFIGTAILQTPFFALGHFYAKITKKYSSNGFSSPYQNAIRLAAFFYLFCALVFIRLILKSYQINRFWIWIVQFGILFCSPILNYIYFDSAYSHLYSFFAVSGLLFYIRSYLQKSKQKQLFLAFIFLALVVLIRPVNLLILLFIPLLIDNFKSFRHSISTMWHSHKKTLILGFISFFLLLQIQCLIWYFQTGSWIYYSYGSESFIWTEPHIIDFLFSYRKGFFLWSPWFFVLIIGAIIFHFFIKKIIRLVYFLTIFIALIYVLSSWWYWSYGACIGSRVMIDYYPALIIFIAPIFAQNTGKIKWITLISLPFFAYLMVVQVYQYQHYILTWDEMNKTTYWEVFLKTDVKYEGYLWKK